MFVGPELMYSISTINLYLIVITYMCMQTTKLTLYVLEPLPLLSFVIYNLSVVIHRRSTIVQQYLSRLTTFTQESFSGILVIKAYGMKAATNTSFEALAEGSKQKNVDLARVQALFGPLMILLIGISNILVAYIGGSPYINGQLDQ